VRTRAQAFARLALVVLSATVVACGHASHPTASRTASGPTATPIATDLDVVFTSPTGRFTMRVNKSWHLQEMATQAGLLDYFALPDAALSVVSDEVAPGTQLDHFVQATYDQYHQAQVQELARAGAIEIGGAQGQLLRARTYVDAGGSTAFAPPAPGAVPRRLYQAFYVAGTVGYTFSMAWPEDDSTDYLSLFRAVLKTFTLGGAT
jgi:hypothetical protein